MAGLQTPTALGGGITNPEETPQQNSALGGGVTNPEETPQQNPALGIMGYCSSKWKYIFGIYYKSDGLSAVPRAYDKVETRGISVEFWAV